MTMWESVGLRPGTEGLVSCNKSIREHIWSSGASVSTSHQLPTNYSPTHLYPFRLTKSASALLYSCATHAKDAMQTMLIYESLSESGSSAHLPLFTLTSLGTG